MRIILRITLAAAALAPVLVPAQEPGPAEEDEVLAESLFMYDALPVGERELNLILGIEESEPDPVTGEASLVSVPVVELAMPFGARLGLATRIAIATDGEAILDAPAASLKYLLRRPGAHRLGLSASLDVVGSMRSASDTEAGLGLGAIRAVGPVALRATVSGATTVSSWSPRLEGGLSAAIAFGSSWCALAEVVTKVAGGDVTFAAGPTVKIDIGEHLAIKGGALFPLAPGIGTPSFAIQLTQSL